MLPLLMLDMLYRLSLVVLNPSSPVYVFAMKRFILVTYKMVRRIVMTVNSHYRRVVQHVFGNFVQACCVMVERICNKFVQEVAGQYEPVNKLNKVSFVIRFFLFSGTFYSFYSVANFL